MSGTVANIQRDGKPVAGAEPGNSRAVSHGAWSTLQLAPRAAELADGLRAVVPTYDASKEPMVQVAALALARLERAQADLDDNDLTTRRGQLRPLTKVIGTFQAEARRCLEALALTPNAQARLGRDTAAIVDLASAMSDRRDDLVERALTGRGTDS